MSPKVSNSIDLYPISLGVKKTNTYFLYHYSRIASLTSVVFMSRKIHPTLFNSHWSFHMNLVKRDFDFGEVKLKILRFKIL